MIKILKSNKLIFSNYIILVYLTIILFSPSCIKNQSAFLNSTHYIYTSLNGIGPNMVNMFKIDQSSFNVTQETFLTQGLGAADTNRYAPLRGCFSSQGGIDLIQNKLLVVNPGSNDITVFNIDKPSGNLTFLNKTNSGGVRPVSLTSCRATYNFITQSPNVDTNIYCVLVANQKFNVVGFDTGINLIKYPNADFYNTLNQKDPERNVSLFQFNATTGALNFIKTLDYFQNIDGAVNSVVFNRKANQFAVVTGGIVQITDEPEQVDSNFQKPGKLYVYNFVQGAQLLSQPLPRIEYYENGCSDLIGFSWSLDDKNIYLTNANLSAAKYRNSLVTLSISNNSINKIQNFATSNAAMDAACWSLVDSVRNLLMISSTGDDAITVYKINQQNTLNIFGNNANEISYFFKYNTYNGSNDNTELFLLENKLYNVRSFDAFTFNMLLINNDGSLVPLVEADVKGANIRSQGVYNFLGLVGYKN